MAISSPPTVRLLGDGRRHGDLLVPMVRAEDVVGQAPETDAAGTVLVGGDRRFRGNARTVLAELDTVVHRSSLM